MHEREARLPRQGEIVNTLVVQASAPRVMWPGAGVSRKLHRVNGRARTLAAVLCVVLAGLLAGPYIIQPFLRRR